jgi:hypothetical protein
MVATPNRKTKTSSSTTTLNVDGVTKKHGASPRKTPRKKKSRRSGDEEKEETRAKDEEDASTLKAMFESFQSMSLSWHDSRSVDLRMLKPRR